MKPLREAFVLVLRTPRLWAVQFLGNAVILLLYAGWLRLPEAHWWDLLLNFVVLLLAIVGALALHGGTLNYFPSAHADRAALAREADLAGDRHRAPLVARDAVRVPAT